MAVIDADGDVFSLDTGIRPRSPCLSFFVIQLNLLPRGAEPDTTLYPFIANVELLSILEPWSFNAIRRPQCPALAPIELEGKIGHFKHLGRSP